MTTPSRIVAEALRVLAELCAAGEPLSVRVDHGGMRASLEVRAASSPKDEAPPETTATEDEVIALLGSADGPMKVITIARRLKRKATSRFRNVVYSLAARRVLVRVEGSSYWLAARGAPPETRE